MFYPVRRTARTPPISTSISISISFSTQLRTTGHSSKARTHSNYVTIAVKRKLSGSDFLETEANNGHTRKVTARSLLRTCTRRRLNSAASRILQPQFAVRSVLLVAVGSADVPPVVPQGCEAGPAQTQRTTNLTRGSTTKPLISTLLIAASGSSPNCHDTEGEIGVRSSVLRKRLVTETPTFYWRSRASVTYLFPNTTARKPTPSISPSMTIKPGYASS
jgi:hypothetical protein